MKKEKCEIINENLKVTNTIFIVKPMIYSTQGILIYTCNIPKYDGLIEYNLSSYTCNIPKYDGLIEYNLSSYTCNIPKYDGLIEYNLLFRKIT
jgi:hypothetical protein